MKNKYKRKKQRRRKKRKKRRVRDRREHQSETGLLLTEEATACLPEAGNKTREE